MIRCGGTPAGPSLIIERPFALVNATKPTKPGATRRG
jgi:hypothetical protein